MAVHTARRSDWPGHGTAEKERCIHVNRRHFLQLGAAAGAAVVLPKGLTRAAQAQTPARLAGAEYASKFTARLPRPRRVDLRLLARTNRGRGPVPAAGPRRLSGDHALRLSHPWERSQLAEGDHRRAHEQADGSAVAQPGAQGKWSDRGVAPAARRLHAAPARGSRARGAAACHAPARRAHRIGERRSAGRLVHPGLGPSAASGSRSPSIAMTSISGAAPPSGITTTRSGSRA